MKCSILLAWHVLLEINLHCKLLLKNVRHVLNILLNLIFIGCLDDEGYSGYIGKGKWRLSQRSLIIAEGAKLNTLYETQTKICKGKRIQLKIPDKHYGMKDLTILVKRDLRPSSRSDFYLMLKHHCRCCGKTLCSEHSSKQMALPQFGIYSNVRVCDDCFNSPRPVIEGQGRSSTVAAVVDVFPRLNVDESEVPEAKSISTDAVAKVIECKCGMPLCICKPPTPDPLPSQNCTVSSSQLNPRPKKPSSKQQTAESISRKPSSSSNSMTSSFSNMGQASNGAVDKPKADYEVNGEGLREAIKNSDPAAVRKLLSEGVDANYCDKQGLTLLHLAALFNQTEITFILMDHGASVERKNAQGETPLDCAPTMLQYKMRQKMAVTADPQPAPITL